MASIRIYGVLFAALFAGALGFGVQFTRPDGISYEGNFLYNVHVKTAQEALRLMDIQRSFNRIISDEHFNPLTRIDVWPDHEIGVGDIMIRVPPAVNREFQLKLDKKGFSYDIVSQNFQELINKEAQNNQLQDSDSFFDTYRTYEDFEQFLRDLAATYPTIASVFHVGNSYEGRNITGIRIAGPANATRPGFFFNGGQHAREWIAPATVAYIANELVTQYGISSEITALVDGVEFFIVPLVNPDGYVYTQQDRMWRKNRSKGRTLCYGVDTNRNWDYQWNTGGSSGVSCEETYHGPSPFSEKENTAVAQFISDHADTIQAYIDFHSYSQVFMNPWGYTRQLPPDNAVQQKVANGAADAMKAVYGKTYEVGTTANLLYIASGGSHDW